MPCHLAPCPGGDRPDRLLCRFQERAEIFKFNDQSVLDSDHMVGTLTLALEVDHENIRRAPTTTRSHEIYGPRHLGCRRYATLMRLGTGGSVPGCFDVARVSLVSL